MCFRAIWTALQDEHTARGISSLTSALQTLGIVVALVGAFMAWDQLRDTRNALRATTALQIQKDGRELFGSMDPDTASYIYAFDAQKKYNPVVVQKAQIRVIQILNYYASASRQHDYRTIDNNLWRSIETEFCKALKNYDVFKQFWAQAVQKKIYRANFIEVGQACLGQAKP
jgi:hypothetical protein